MARATILYVEDEEYDVLFMRRAFHKAAPAYELRVVTDGQKAIDYLSDPQQARPDLILLDLNLPLVSGFEVLEWMRSQDGYTQVPVVIFSSSARPEDRIRAEATGANDYLQKPSSALEFRTVIDYLDRRWFHDGLAAS
jgi:DNA-binding response OmpR family regulator